MNKNIIYIFLLSVFFSFSGSSQDAFHYTYFDMTEVALNPALAGGFEGTVRLGGLFRGQDYGLSLGQYNSPVFYIDAPLIRGLRKQDWIGFGFSMQSDDQAFSYFNPKTSSTINNKFSTITSIGGLSYHFALDKKRKNVLAIGVQSGSSSVSFKEAYLVTGESIKDYIDNPGTEIGKEYQGNLPSGKKKKSIKLGYTIGAVFTSNMSKTKNLKVGVSVSRIGNRLTYSVVEKGSSIYQNKVRISSFGKYRTELSSGLILEPRMFFQFAQPSWEASAQMLAGLRLKKPTSMIIYGGIGYSINNGLQFLFSADIKDIKVAFSFDLNLSDKTIVSGPGGAFEIGASYIFKLNKKPNPDPVLVCPNL